MVPRLTVIADREWLNLGSLILHSNEHSESFQLGGLVVPFHELDLEVMQLIYLSYMMKWKGNGEFIPLTITDRAFEASIQLIDEALGRNMHGKKLSAGLREEVEADSDLVFFGSGNRIYYFHAPYKPKMTEEERKAYSLSLLEKLRATKPDLIFMSNFKAVLDAAVPEAFPGRLINVHPSILPYNRGWRTEKMALEQNNPEASGYTMHIAVPEVDRGEVLFQQQVPIGGHTEESLRLATISAQSIWVPRVLELYLSGIERKVVEGEEALRAENRALKGAGHNGYRRMLFYHGEGYRTMEDILGAPKIAPREDVHSIQRYRFILEGSSTETLKLYSKLTKEVNILDFSTHYLTASGVYGARQYIVTTIDGGKLGDILAHNNILFEIIHLPITVNAKRINPK